MLNNENFHGRHPHRAKLRWGLILLATLFATWMSSTAELPWGLQRTAFAQGDTLDDSEPAGPSAVEPGGDLPAEFDDAQDQAPVEDEPTSAGSSNVPESLNLLSVLLEGGWFFLTVLGLMSLLVVTMTIERFLALRRDRVMPEGLISALGKLGSGQGGFDPRQAYRLCQQFPSATSTVIRAMLLKVGRPLPEVQHSVQEASQREADRMFANVRWLTLSVAVAPLIGLLGTVWGMILAFHQTTQLSPDQSKAEQLAHGIWTALVTTLCGLVIAITAAIFAHFFEGRITSLFHQIDEMLFNLLPQIERYEGRVRFSRQSGDGDQDDQAPLGEVPAELTPPPVQSPPVPSRSSASPK